MTATTLEARPYRLKRVPLEPAAQEFADSSANPPYLFDLGPIEGRKVVDQTQDGDIKTPDADCDELDLRHAMRP